MNLMNPPSLSAEQLLIIADVFCREYNVIIVDYAALCACAALSAAHLNGIRIHKSPKAVEESLRQGITKLAPLSDANESFAVFSARVYRAFTDHRN